MEKQNKIEIYDKRQDKIDLKYQIYIDQKRYTRLQKIERKRKKQ